MGIQDIVLKDIEKRRIPTKHYAYIIEVTWTDGQIRKIGRRYGDLFEFQMSLLERYPAESGQNNPAQRIIPFFPGKSLFRRSNTREFALKRMGPISEYCSGIAALPRYIIEDDEVENFFRPNTDDKANQIKKTSPERNGGKMDKGGEITGPLVLDKYIVIAAYKKENKKELDLKSGEVVEIVEKNENGWWLAANEQGMNGWVPAVYLEPLYGESSPPTAVKRAKPGDGEMYEAVANFSSDSNEEISFVVGDLLEILEKNLEGWWYAKKGGEEGWVPATYLEISSAPSPMSPSGLPEKDQRFAQWKNRRSIEETKKPPPKRSTVRRTLTKAAAQKVQVDFTAKMLTQESFADEWEPEIDEVYTTVAAFESHIPDSLSFSANETVHIISKSSEGWWYGRIKNKRGWIPENYLSTGIIKTSPSKPPIGGKPLLLKPTSLGDQSNPIKSPENNTTIDARMNALSKPPKPARPPAPKTSNNVGATAKVFGGIVATTEAAPSNKKNALRSPTSPWSPKKGPVSVIPTVSPTKKVDLTQYLWYREVTRQEAEDALLCEGEEGYFIIRPSQRGAKNDKPYSLTLRHQETNWNFHIRLRTDKKYAVGIYKESEACFSTLPELVEYYMNNPLIIGENERKVLLAGSPQELYSAC